MAICLLYRPAPNCHRPRFYRVEIAYNLLEEISVLREWGEAGKHGRSVIDIYANLRQASLAADHWRNGALKRGYQRDVQVG